MFIRTRRSRIRNLFWFVCFRQKTHFAQQDSETAAELVLVKDHSHASPTFRIEFFLECCRLTLYLILIFFVVINFFILGSLLNKKSHLSQFDGKYSWVDETIETAQYVFRFLLKACVF